MKRLRLLLTVTVFIVVFIGLNWGMGSIVAPWLADQVRAQFPFAGTWGPSRFHWPLGVKIEGVTVPDPRGSGQPPFFEVKELTVQVPWWGLFFRPMPVEVTLVAARVRIDTGNAGILGDLFLRGIAGAGIAPAIQGTGTLAPAAPATEAEEEETQGGESPQETKQKPPQAASSASVIGLRVLEGRIDFSDKAAEPDRPLFSIGHLSVKAGAASLFSAPTIEMHALGNYVGPVTGEPIGFITADSRISPTLGNMEGHLQIWHGRLRDLRRIYYYAPQPFFLEGGAGGPIIDWKITGRNHLWVSMRSITKGLRIDGKVGDIPWNTILTTMEDSQQRLDITVTAEGRLDDPAFEVHNQLLSSLDWAFKERCAAKGLRVPTRIFFGLEKPGSDEEDEEEEAESPSQKGSEPDEEE